MTRTAHRLPLALTLLLSLILLITACTPTGEHMKSWYEGDLPLLERQSLEDYDTTFSPTFEAFTHRLEHETNTTPYLLGNSSLSCYGNGEFSHYSATVSFPLAVDDQLIRSIGDEIFTPLGLHNTLHRQDERGAYDLEWIDPLNGGGFSVAIDPDFTNYNATSGPRPSSRAATDCTYTRSDWEQSLPDWEQSTPQSATSD